MKWTEFWNVGWAPDKTNVRYRPENGDLVAIGHAVWSVSNVADIELDDDDRGRWLDAGMPDLATWSRRPFQAHVDHVAGALPEWLAGDTKPGAVVTIHAKTDYRWRVYPKSGRWPQCSCCGEPTPCRAELADRQITASMNDIEKWMSRKPGSCWGCGEQITRRQQSVVYDGDNLDLPGGIPVRIHLRNACRWYAERYELRWLAEDPRRQRILTYPKCPGILYVHADGSSTCVSWRDMLGQEVESAPDCQGHLTHDHGSRSACYGAEGGCPLGCSRKRHPGVSTSPRPLRRPQTTAALPGLTPGA